MLDSDSHGAHDWLTKAGEIARLTGGDTLDLNPDNNTFEIKNAGQQGQTTGPQRASAIDQLLFDIVSSVALEQTQNQAERQLIKKLDQALIKLTKDEAKTQDGEQNSHVEQEKSNGTFAVSLWGAEAKVKYAGGALQSGAVLNTGPAHNLDNPLSPDTKWLFNARVTPLKIDLGEITDALKGVPSPQIHLDMGAVADIKWQDGKPSFQFDSAYFNPRLEIAGGAPFNDDNKGAGIGFGLPVGAALAGATAGYNEWQESHDLGSAVKAGAAQAGKTAVAQGAAYLAGWGFSELGKLAGSQDATVVNAAFANPNGQYTNPFGIGGNHNFQKEGGRAENIGLGAIDAGAAQIGVIPIVNTPNLEVNGLAVTFTGAGLNKREKFDAINNEPRIADNVAGRIQQEQQALGKAPDLDTIKDIINDTIDESRKESKLRVSKQQVTNITQDVLQRVAVSDALDKVAKTQLQTGDKLDASQIDNMISSSLESVNDSGSKANLTSDQQTAVRQEVFSALALQEAQSNIAQAFSRPGSKPSMAQLNEAVNQSIANTSSDGSKPTLTDTQQSDLRSSFFSQFAVGEALDKIDQARRESGEVPSLSDINKMISDVASTFKDSDGKPAINKQDAQNVLQQVWQQIPAAPSTSEAEQKVVSSALNAIAENRQQGGTSDISVGKINDIIGDAINQAKTDGGSSLYPHQAQSVFQEVWRQIPNEPPKAVSANDDSNMDIATSPSWSLSSNDSKPRGLQRSASAMNFAPNDGLAPNAMPGTQVAPPQSPQELAQIRESYNRLSEPSDTFLYQPQPNFNQGLQGVEPLPTIDNDPGNQPTIRNYLTNIAQQFGLTPSLDESGTELRMDLPSGAAIPIDIMSFGGVQDAAAFNHGEQRVALGQEYLQQLEGEREAFEQNLDNQGVSGEEKTQQLQLFDQIVSQHVGGMLVHEMTHAQQFENFGHDPDRFLSWRGNTEYAAHWQQSVATQQWLESAQNIPGLMDQVQNAPGYLVNTMPNLDAYQGLIDSETGAYLESQLNSFNGETAPANQDQFMFNNQGPTPRDWGQARPAESDSASIPGDIPRQDSDSSGIDSFFDSFAPSPMPDTGHRGLPPSASTSTGTRGFDPSDSGSFGAQSSTSSLSPSPTPSPTTGARSLDNSNPSVRGSDNSNTKTSGSDGGSSKPGSMMQESRIGTDDSGLTGNFGTGDPQLSTSGELDVGPATLSGEAAAGASTEYVNDGTNFVAGANAGAGVRGSARVEDEDGNFAEVSGGANVSAGARASSTYDEETGLRSSTAGAGVGASADVSASFGDDTDSTTIAGSAAAEATAEGGIRTTEDGVPVGAHGKVGYEAGVEAEITDTHNGDKGTSETMTSIGADVGLSAEGELGMNEDGNFVIGGEFDLGPIGAGLKSEWDIDAYEEQADRIDDKWHNGDKVGAVMETGDMLLDSAENIPYIGEAVGDFREAAGGFIDGGEALVNGDFGGAAKAFGNSAIDGLEGILGSSQFGKGLAKALDDLQNGGFEDLMNGLENHFNMTMSVFDDVGDEIKDFAEDVGDNLKNTASIVGGGIKDAAEDIGDGVKTAASVAKKTAEDVGEGIKEGAEKVGEGVKDVAEDVGEGIKEGAEKVGEGVKDVAEDVGEGIKDGAEKVFDGIKSIF